MNSPRLCDPKAAHCRETDQSDRCPLGQSVLMRVRCRGSSRRHVQLGEDVAQMSLDRLVAQYQGARNVGIAAALGNQSQDLNFTFGEAAGPRSSQQLVDLLDSRQRTQFGKAVAGNRQFGCCRILITELA